MSVRLREMPTIRDLALWLDPLAFEDDPRDSMNRRRGSAMEQARVIHQRLVKLKV